MYLEEYILIRNINLRRRERGGQILNQFSKPLSLDDPNCKSCLKHMVIGYQTGIATLIIFLLSLKLRRPAV